MYIYMHLKLLFFATLFKGPTDGRNKHNNVYDPNIRIYTYLSIHIYIAQR